MRPLGSRCSVLVPRSLLDHLRRRHDVLDEAAGVPLGFLLRADEGAFVGRQGPRDTQGLA